MYSFACPKTGLTSYPYITPHYNILFNTDSPTQSSFETFKQACQCSTTWSSHLYMGVCVTTDNLIFYYFIFVWNILNITCVQNNFIWFPINFIFAISKVWNIVCLIFPFWMSLLYLFVHNRKPLIWPAEPLKRTRPKTTRKLCASIKMQSSIFFMR